MKCSGVEHIKTLMLFPDGTQHNVTACLFREAEEETRDDSAPAGDAPSVQVSDKEPTASPSQLIPVVRDIHTPLLPQDTHTHTLLSFSA